MRLAYQFQDQISKVRVTRPINAGTHRASHVSNAKAYEFQTWYTNEGRRHASADQRSRSQGHVISVSRVGLMAH